jgi:hypothetical protein
MGISKYRNSQCTQMQEDMLVREKIWMDETMMHE